METIKVIFEIPAGCAHRLALFPKGEKELARYLGADTADDEPDPITLRNALLSWIENYKQKLLWVNNNNTKE